MKTNDMQERIALVTTLSMAVMGYTALLGIIFKAGKIDPTVMALLAGVVGSTVAGLPSLLAKLTGSPAGDADPTSVIVENTKKDPIPVVTDKDKKP